MSYQVLARKWRPRFFREMVGQEHVLQALINALDHNRLHHAYLFTGTRGVGKTTIARILAKCLNCEVGVSSEPCGQCSSCQEIAQGSFVDLIEVDAASRTKVEDTRELLDNVQYAPSKGRFKVYLIDEVHMLSTHSFNALLKTLEEPPEHVKFLLATTDPQKLPATILSRCLQFHLKNMAPERIVGHLSHVLTQEGMRFEDAALWALARSAHGSMRDALSLTDQAIAFGTGSVLEDAVSNMLGSIDQNTVYTLMQGLIDYNTKNLMDEVARFSEHAPDFNAVLDELLMLMHRMTLAQLDQNCVDNSQGDKDKVISLAQQLAAEELQLFYQMGIMGKRDLGLAPDLRTGFEMTLMRMLTFRPQGLSEPLTRALPASHVVNPSHDVPVEQSATVNDAETVSQQSEAVAEGSEKKPELGSDSRPNLGDSAEPDATTLAQNTESAESVVKELAEPTEIAGLAVESQISQAPHFDESSELDREPLALPIDHQQWLALLPSLPLDGLLAAIAEECVLDQVDGIYYRFLLNLSKAQLFNQRHVELLKAVLVELSQQTIELHIDPLEHEAFLAAANGKLTAADVEKKRAQEAQHRAEQVISQDEVLADIVEAFAGEIIPSTIKAIEA